jgi:hypothetical protein
LTGAIRVAARGLINQTQPATKINERHPRRRTCPMESIVIDIDDE